MNLEGINWNMIGSATAVIGFIALCWRNLKTDLKEKIAESQEYLKKEISYAREESRTQNSNLREEARVQNSNLREEYRTQFTALKTEIRDFRSEMNTDYEFLFEQITDIKDNHSEVIERLSFMEAATLYTMPLEPAQVNQRSQAAREMWKRRKQKKLEKKG